jgi:hypothetical protein
MNKAIKLLIFIIFNSLIINMVASETQEENWGDWTDRWTKLIKADPTDSKIFETIGK